MLLRLKERELEISFLLLFFRKAGKPAKEEEDISICSIPGGQLLSAIASQPCRRSDLMTFANLEITYTFNKLK